MNSERPAFDADAYGMAVRIKEIQGSQEHLKEIGKRLTATVAGYETLPTIMPLRNGQRQEMVPRRVVVPPYTRRSLTAADRAVLRRRFPDVYAAAVKVTPPVRKYSVRLDVQTGLGLRSSEEWAQIAAAAAAKTDARFLKQFDGEDWKLKTTNVSALFAVQQELRTLNAQLETNRVRLAEFFESAELPVVLRGLTDGRISARELGETFEVDYDYLETTAAAVLVKASQYPGSTSIRYAPPKADPMEEDEEPFEGW